LQVNRADFKLTVKIPFILILISSFDFSHSLNFYSIIRSSGSCSCSIVFSQVFLIIFYFIFILFISSVFSCSKAANISQQSANIFPKAANISQQSANIFPKAANISQQGANIFYRLQTFPFERKDLAQSFQGSPIFKAKRARSKVKSRKQKQRQKKK
jgi:hypothetical protein